MKKILSLVLLVAIAVGSLCLVSCGEKNYQVGVGISATVNAKNADGEEAGTASLTATMAAIAIDEDGKIISCDLDSTYYGEVSVSATGACEIAKAMTTKGELGTDYGMAAIANTKEWYEQADIFASVAVGKTLDEVKALVASDYKGNEEVVNAGCTIYVSDFSKAIEKAYENLKSFSTKEKLNADSVNLGTYVSASATNADGDTDGKITFGVVASSAVMSEGKVVSIITDELSAELAVASTGAITGADAAVKTKRELGTDYGMSTNPYAQDLNGDGKVLEWFEQINVFDAACEGKNADEIAALTLSTGYATDDVQSAGCTINVYTAVKACVAAAK